MCENKAKQLNKSQTVTPEHITGTIMMFAGCNRCEKEIETIELMHEIEALNNNGEHDN